MIHADPLLLFVPGTLIAAIVLAAVLHGREYIKQNRTPSNPKTTFLVAYFHQDGEGRCTLDFYGGDLPSVADIERWEKWLEENCGLTGVGIRSFQRIAPEPDQPSTPETEHPTLSDKEPQ